MSERQRVDILGCGVDLVDTAGALSRILELMRAGQSSQVVTFGAEMATHALRDTKYREIVNAADLVVADTIGIVWASRVLGRPLRERVAGIELVEAILQHAPIRTFLVGAENGVAEAAAAELRALYPSVDIAGTHHGYFPDAQGAAVADAICAARARLVLVALGFPRQEFWIREHLSRLGGALCIGVGGAFDVWAGRTKRAPVTWRSAGLEWLHRLASEPRRLRRQLALPSFAVRVLWQALARPRTVG